MKVIASIICIIAAIVPLHAQSAQLKVSVDYTQGSIPATGLIVERATGSATSPGTFGKIATIPITATTGFATYTYTDADPTLVAGSSYSYRVKAYNDGGAQSVYSNIASGVAANLPPPPPNGTYGTPTATPPPKFIALNANSKVLIYNGNALMAYNASSQKLNISPFEMGSLGPGQSALVSVQ
jgi:hypothetical protein